MENVLPSTSLHIEHQFVARAAASQFFCDLLSPEDQLRNNRPIRLSQIVDASYVLPRNQKDVYRRMGMDVLKGNDRFSLIDQLCRFFTPDNLAENAILLGQVSFTSSLMMRFTQFPSSKIPEDFCSRFHEIRAKSLI